MSSPKSNKHNVNNEEVFALIEKGNALVETSPIEAIESFYDVSEKLKLAVEYSRQQEVCDDKIIDLYDRQFRFYREKARVIFLDYLKDGVADGWTSQERARLFSKLFNNGQAFSDSIAQIESCNSEIIDVQNLSLEERLAALRVDDQNNKGNASRYDSQEDQLCCRLKTIKDDNEREARISHGLAKLGIDVNTNNKTALELDVQEHDEVDEIIAQVQDATRLDNEVENANYRHLNILDSSNFSKSEDFSETESISDNSSNSKMNDAVNALISKTMALVYMERERSNSNSDGEDDEHMNTKCINNNPEIANIMPSLDRTRNAKSNGSIEIENDQAVKITSQTPSLIEMENKYPTIPSSEIDLSNANFIMEKVMKMDFKDNTTQYDMSTAITSSIDLLQRARKCLDNEDNTNDPKMFITKAVEILCESLNVTNYESIDKYINRH